MKIKYWLGLAVVLAACTFYASKSYVDNANNLHSSRVTMTAPAKIANKPEAAALSECPDYATKNPDAMSEKDLRFYVKSCSYLHLANENFPALDSTIAFLRNHKSRTPSGLWMQSLFYAGVEEYVGNIDTEVGFLQTEESIQRWIDMSTDPAAAHLSMSTLMIHKAWQYRGTGLASTVSADNFRLFHEQISKTKKYLLGHENISNEDPEWFSQMLMITRVDENSDEKNHLEYFDKAAKLYPGYYPVYFTAAVFYLPKWGGDKEAFEQFARYSISKLAPEEAGQLYARMYWSEICGRCGDQEVGDWKKYWPEMDAGFEQLIRQFPDQWNINGYAHIACMAGDKEKTLAMMQKIEGDPIGELWGGEFNYLYCANWSGSSNKVENG